MNLSFDFIGPINDDNIMCLCNFIVNQEEPINHLTINISSLGGATASGITIYNYLKQQSFPITTHNLGEVSSAAVLLYLAGTSRTAEAISKFMIHPVQVSAGNDLPYHKVEELLKIVDADIKNYAKIVNTETNSLNGLFDVDAFLRTSSITFDVGGAYKCGIVTKMSE